MRRIGAINGARAQTPGRACVPSLFGGHALRSVRALRTAFALFVVFTILATTGCVRESVEQGVPTKPLSKMPDRVDPKAPPLTPESSASANTDPCAMRLHDVCGALLVHYLTFDQLPVTLEALKQLPGQEMIQLACPSSGKPFAYNTTAIIRPERGDRIVCYDSTPSHKGFRWAISIIEPQPGQPLVTKVIALPESTFRFSK